MFHRIEIRNVRLRNALDVDLKIKWSQKCPKPPKDNDKRQRQVRFNEKVNRACDNGKNNNDLKIYASMARMSSDDERKSEKYGDSSQLTNWILDLGATYHMTPRVSDFIPGSLEIRNVRLRNALYVNLKIPWSQNVPSHQNIMRNGEGKYVLIQR